MSFLGKPKDLQQICRIALKYSHEQYISGITRIKGGYLFGFCNKDGDEKIINPVFGNEDTGKAGGKYLGN